ncbi:MAG TPA: glycosyltransferase family 4 protein [Hyphomonadaceae bacterium]|nr:glycosyltransferase family 4 protein [Hyphomonadaceae bacterium]
MVERVIFPFRGAELGGSHVATFTLAKALRDSFQIECVVVCPQDSLIMNEARRLGIRVIPNGEEPTGRNSALTDFMWAQRRRRILQPEAAAGGAIVHCNDINTLRSWGLAARLAGMGVVYQHHALNRLWWPPHLLSLSHASAVSSVSDSTTAAMMNWRRDVVKELNPFEIAPNFDRLAAREAILKEFAWPSNTLVMGWIGNFWDRKRPFFFLEVAAELAKRNTRYRFVMFGRDGDHSLRDVQQRALAMGIHWATALPGFRQPVEGNVACLDLLLAPAPREPFGRALVEAIILGTPIVATRGAGHSEIINAWGGGLLVDQDDNSQRVAQLCAEVMANPDRYRLPQKRRKEIAASLSPESHAGRMMALYGQAARGDSGRQNSITGEAQRRSHGRRAWRLPPSGVK